MRSLKLLILFFLIIITSQAFAEYKSIFLLEYKSDNGEYIVTTKDLKDGKGFCSIKNKKGEILSEFITNEFPMSVCISNTGERSFVFLGDRTDEEYEDEIYLYDLTGKILYSDKIQWPWFRRFSSDGNYFVIQNLYKTELVLTLYNTKDGKIELRKPLKEYYDSPGYAVVSNNAEWIVISGSIKKNKLCKIILFDKKGEKYWDEDITGSSVITGISEDGTKFEVDDRVNRKKYIFENHKGKVSKFEVLDFIKE